MAHPMPQQSFCRKMVCFLYKSFTNLPFAHIVASPGWLTPPWWSNSQRWLYLRFYLRAFQRGSHPPLEILNGKQTKHGGGMGWGFKWCSGCHMFFLLVNFWACRRVVFRGVYINYMDYVSTMHLVFTGVYKTVGFGENVFSEKTRYFF